jgi:hypothetical protein
MISPPKYEKKSVAYIDKTEIIYPSLVTTQEKNKVCKFYRISPAFIQSISNIPEDMKIYIHSNEYILHTNTDVIIDYILFLMNRVLCI